MHKVFRRFAGLVFMGGVILSCAGCASYNAVFFDRHINNQDKARIITEAGIKEYNAQLVSAGALDLIPQVREYFVVAISFDPAYAPARKYLDLVDGFKATTLKQYLLAAQTLSGKALRNEDENGEWCSAIRHAALIAPQDPEVRKLLADSVAQRAALTVFFQGKAKDAFEKSGKATNSTTRETLIISAFQSVMRSLDADPANSTARRLKRNIRSEVDTIIKTRLNGLAALYATAAFPVIRSQFEFVNDLNRQLGNDYEAEVRAAGYRLYTNWARYLLAQKDFEQAQAKVDLALEFRQDAEGRGLKLYAQGVAAYNAEKFDQAIDLFEQATAIDAGYRQADSYLERARTKKKLLDGY